MEYQEFPKMLYLNGDPTNQKIVNNQAEEDALGAKWVDAPTVPGLTPVVPVEDDAPAPD